MAAYKRLATVQAPHSTESEPHHHKQITLSLSFQLQIKFTNPEKVQEHSNPNRFPELKFNTKATKIREVLSDSY